jgi:hypothetical protein
VHDTSISRLLLTVLLFPMVALWAFHLYQRKFKDAAAHKRITTLSYTVLVIVAWVVAWFFARNGIGDTWLLVLPVLAVAAAAWQRGLFLPYRLHCVKCGKPLGLGRILSIDANTCEACEPPQKEGDTT